MSVILIKNNIINHGNNIYICKNVYTNVYICTNVPLYKK